MENRLHNLKGLALFPISMILCACHATKQEHCGRTLWLPAQDHLPSPLFPVLGRWVRGWVVLAIKGVVLSCVGQC